jgi:hypothetical protein
MESQIKHYESLLRIELIINLVILKIEVQLCCDLCPIRFSLRHIIQYPSFPIHIFQINLRSTDPFVS